MAFVHVTDVDDVAIAVGGVYHDHLRPWLLRQGKSEKKSHKKSIDCKDREGLQTVVAIALLIALVTAVSLKVRVKSARVVMIAAKRLKQKQPSASSSIWKWMRGKKSQRAQLQVECTIMLN